MPFVLQLQKDGEWAKWVDLAFAKLDTNNDGYIDLEELIVQLPGMGVGIDERRDSERLLAVRAQAGVCPASQSGAIRTVWGQGLCRGAAAALFEAGRYQCKLLHFVNKAALQARRMLREADANGDGLVSKHEFIGLLSETNVPDGLGELPKHADFGVTRLCFCQQIMGQQSLAALSGSLGRLWLVCRPI